MKDSVVRGRLLQLLFDRRKEGPLPFGSAEGAVPPPPGVADRAWLHALAQLVEYDLVSWQPQEEKRAGASMSGLAEITETGMDVREGRNTSDIDIRFC